MERPGFRGIDLVGEAQRVIIIIVLCVEAGHAASFCRVDAGRCGFDACGSGWDRRGKWGDSSWHNRNRRWGRGEFRDCDESCRVDDFGAACHNQRPNRSPGPRSRRRGFESSIVRIGGFRFKCFKPGRFDARGSDPSRSGPGCFRFR